VDDNDSTLKSVYRDLDYIPYGFNSSKAPYIETSAATIRGTAELITLDIIVRVEVASTHQDASDGSRM